MSEPRIFVTYARSDGQDAARQVRDRLHREGFALWQDLVALEGGRDWWSQIEDALKAPSVEHLVLVMTPSVMDRPIVRREIRLARQEAVQVSPVMVSDELQLSNLPRWMGHVQDIRHPEQWARLVATLRGPSTQQRVPFMAPALMNGFVPRPVEFEALKHALLDSKGDAVAITAALRGAGGYGKTVLATALCHDADVQSAYFDGILWITLGEQPDDLLWKIKDLIITVTGEPPGFNTVGAAAAKLREVLGDRRFLLVIDDAWRTQDLRPLLQGGPTTTRLITTRIAGVLPRPIFSRPVDAMSTGQAVTLLAKDLPVNDVVRQRPSLTELSERLGEWPFLLTLVNRFLIQQLDRGQTLTRALDGVARRLDTRGIVAFDADEAVAKTLELSLSLLSAAKRQRFMELGVFAEDAQIPLGVVARLWSAMAELEELEAEDLLSELFSLSLVLDHDLGDRTCRLHDVMRQYLLTRIRGPQLDLLHRKVSAVLESTTVEESNARERKYAYRYLAWHLHGAGDAPRVQALLLDVQWMNAKILATDSQSLLSDFQLIERSLAHDLVYRVLDLIAGILARDSSQLAIQLLARLTPTDAEGIDELLAQARTMVSRPAIVTHRPSLTAPGVEIRRFEGHQKGITGVIAVDHKRILSSSEDGTIRLWNISNAEQLRCIRDSDGAVSCLARVDDACVAWGSEGAVVRVLDFESGTEPRCLSGHYAAVTCITVHQGRLVSGSRDGTIRVWDLATDTEVGSLHGHNGSISCVASCGAYLVSSAEDLTLRVWDVASGRELRQLDAGQQPFMARALAITALDTQRVMTGGTDYGTARIWDLHTGVLLQQIYGFRFWIRHIVVLDSRRLVISCYGYGESVVYDLAREARELLFPGFVHTTMPLEHQMVAGNYNDTVRLWTAAPEFQLQRWSGAQWWIASFLQLDTDRMVSASWNGTMSIWDRRDGRELVCCRDVHTQWVNNIVRLDEHRAVSCTAYNKSIAIWHTDTGEVLRRFESTEQFTSDEFTDAPTDYRALAVVNPSRVVSGSFRKTLRVWDAESGAMSFELAGHTDHINAVRVLDQRHIVSASCDRTLRVWDLEQRIQVHRLEGHTAGVTDVAVLDACCVVSSSPDRTLRVWDIQLGVQVRCIDVGHPIRQVAALDARHVVVATSDDRLLRLWDLLPGTERELARIECDIDLDVISALSDGRSIGARDTHGGFHVFDILLPEQPRD